MNEKAHGEGAPLGVFALGALFGVALAFLASRRPASGNLHVDDWLETHGLTGHHLLDRVKKLLHVRKNGHSLPGGHNGNGTVRRHK